MSIDTKDMVIEAELMRCTINPHIWTTELCGLIYLVVVFCNMCNEVILMACALLAVTLNCLIQYLDGHFIGTLDIPCYLMYDHVH